MAPLTRTFSEVDHRSLSQVGGKGANLGVLTRAGLTVPPGFCVTTAAYRQFIARLPDATARFAELEALDGSSAEAARAAAESMRRALEPVQMPAEVATAIASAWHSLGVEHPLAVRSSATAEDLPGASFAGQQDTFLNVRGEVALLEAVRRCWISLFSDRAVLYRARGRFGHRAVEIGVVVQRLIDPEASGILFTADPISGHRHIASIDAGFGLGEALVSGVISADLYQVDRRSHRILTVKPGDKPFAIRSVSGGGTRRESIPEDLRHARVLNDEAVLKLVSLGSKIEALYGGEPQDLEWCIERGSVYILQARPITSLYPVPPPAHPEAGPRVYLSFGHFQMMHDAMPRLALEVWRLFFPAGKPLPADLASRPALSEAMLPAGGRLFIDATEAMRVPPMRRAFLGLLSHVYEAFADALRTLVERPEFAHGTASPEAVAAGAVRILGPVIGRVPHALLFSDPAVGADRFHAALVEIPSASADRIASRPTAAARIRQCATELNAVFWRVRRHLPRIFAGILAQQLLKRLARAPWADGVREEVDHLSRGVPGNVTTQMDLAVGDLGDLVRPNAALAHALRTHRWNDARPQLGALAGGPEFAAAMDAFLARYGNRGAGEIDVSRPRWRDDPSLLLKVIAGGANKDPGAHRRHHQAQIDIGEQAARRLIEAAGAGPLGALRRRFVARLVRVARLGMGLREHPKFIIVQTLALVRAEVLAAARTLVERGQLSDPSSVWHLGFEELAGALEEGSIDLRESTEARAVEFRRDQARKPPIAMSSDGEIPALGGSRKDLPPGALAGTAASAGIVEGVARVITDPERDVLHDGEILVAPFTDPGWTPLFVHAIGLVTEVGGLMTHGAVVAREYGIPAVVSVSSAVERIKTGQRIRVDGTRGFVEILEGA